MRSIPKKPDQTAQQDEGRTLYKFFLYHIREIHPSSICISDRVPCVDPIICDFFEQSGQYTELVTRTRIPDLDTGFLNCFSQSGQYLDSMDLTVYQLSCSKSCLQPRHVMASKRNPFCRSVSTQVSSEFSQLLCTIGAICRVNGCRVQVLTTRA